MVRITVEAEPFRQFGIGEFTDHYVKLQFPPAGAPYEVPFDPAEVKRTLPPRAPSPAAHLHGA